MKSNLEQLGDEDQNPGAHQTEEARFEGVVSLVTILEIETEMRMI